MRELVADDVPHTGELLDGRYRLDSRAGEGGMATVYRAEDTQLGRTVAIKVFRPGTAEAADTARTLSETRVLASLNHPALVTLHDARVEDADRSYLVMEYVEGPTLRDRIAEGAMPPSDVASMAFDLAEALHVVHEGGVVHRDIKPSNVLLRPSRTPGPAFRAKLADFGIAYLVDSTRVTMPGTIMGTAAYLSPEQVRGASPAPAADIYALGLLLIEALTGRRAFPQTGTHEALMARVTGSPEIPGDLGYAWKSLLTSMTAPKPDDRPTALAVAVAARELQISQLSAGLSSGPLPAGPLDLAATGALPVVASAATGALPVGDAGATGAMPIGGADATSAVPAAGSGATGAIPVADTAMTADATRAVDARGAVPPTPALDATALLALPHDLPPRRERRSGTRRRRRLLALTIGLPAAAVVVLAVMLASSFPPAALEPVSTPTVEQSAVPAPETPVDPASGGAATDPAGSTEPVTETGRVPETDPVTETGPETGQTTEPEPQPDVEPAPAAPAPVEPAPAEPAPAEPAPADPGGGGGNGGGGNGNGGGNGSGNGNGKSK